MYIDREHRGYIHLYVSTLFTRPGLQRLQALRVVRARVHAGGARNTSSRSAPSQAAALAPLGDSAAAGGARGRRGRGGAGARGGAGGRGAAQEADDRGVGGLGAEVGVPQAGVALAGEGAGDPGVEIGEVPHGDADAVGDGEAGGDGVDVVGGLLLVARGGGREGREADVELGVGDLDAEGGEALEVGRLGCEVGGRAYDVMGLETNTVNLDATGLEGLDDVLCCGGLGSRVLNVVVIVVQLDIGIVQNYSLERDGNVLGSNLGLVSILSRGIGTYLGDVQWCRRRQPGRCRRR